MGPAAGHGRGGSGMMGICRRFDPITASCAPVLRSMAAAEASAKETQKEPPRCWNTEAARRNSFSSLFPPPILAEFEEDCKR